MKRDDYYELRRKATLVIQAQIRNILEEIIADKYVSHNNSSLIEPIGRLWDILGLEWIKDDDNVPVL